MLAIKDCLSALIINFKKLKKKKLKVTGIPRKKSLYFVYEKLVEVNIKAKNK